MDGARKPSTRLSSPAWLSSLSHYVTLTSHLSSFCTSFLICSSFLHPSQVCLRLPVCFSTSKTSSCQWQTNSRWNLSITCLINHRKMPCAKIINRKKKNVLCSEIIWSCMRRNRNSYFCLVLSNSLKAQLTKKWKVLSLLLTHAH